ncbi:MAG: ribonuclease [Streptosporangiaceae bacterium]|nr:ribonuclease [Streptosporangiaceae bacterium]
MSTRDLVVLGSAGAVPTKTRNHNGYLLGDEVRLGTDDAPFALTARRLSHSIEAYGYRLEERGHLTAAQAGRVAAESGVRCLVLTHFSERYRAEDEPRFVAEAASVFDGDIVLVHDLDRVPVPPRRVPGRIHERAARGDTDRTLPVEGHHGLNPR